jgi:hypothetical protein
MTKQPCPILTIDLSRRIERGVAPTPTTAEDLCPKAPRVTRFGQTIASKARGGRPSNKVFCFGPDDLGLLDEILAWYAVEDLEPTFYLSPMGFTREVAEALTAAGFAQRDLEQAILYGLPSPQPAPMAPGVTVERVTADHLEEFVRTVADAFEWPGEWRDAAMEEARHRFRGDAQHFLVRYQGEPAGVGALRLHDGAASLNGGAVVARLRGKGCHLALVHHRLHVARTMDCDLVIGGADFGSASFRNQQRAGLRLAYVESGWSRT